jgi:hypothetical protein
VSVLRKILFAAGMSYLFRRFTGGRRMPRRGYGRF